MILLALGRSRNVTKTREKDVSGRGGHPGEYTEVRESKYEEEMYKQPEFVGQKMQRGRK